MVCTPDAFWFDESLDEVGLVDAKATGRSWGNKIPPSYVAQVRAQGMVTGIENVTLAPYFGKPTQGVPCYDVDRNDEEELRIETECGKFARDVEEALGLPTP